MVGMETVDAFIEKVSAIYGEDQAASIGRAVDFGMQAHREQFRHSGEPYITHPCHVAEILIDLGMDADTITAAVLHDVLEDTLATFDDVKNMFGESVARLVDGVTKLSRLGFFSREERQAESLRKMFVAMANDIRVIMIKLADRLHNMRTLQYVEAQKQMRIANETLEIYSPLAHRLGIYAFKAELDDLAFRYLKPEVFFELEKKVKAVRASQDQQMHEVMNVIRERLEQVSIKADFEGRPKTIYSIYKKMVAQEKPFEEIYDLTAMRVIVESVKDCYTVLGIIHTLWKPLPGRFKDYIAVPSQNMYQSLHTTCLGAGGVPFEVQIRTYDMHRTAEYGIAAHWKYKEKRKGESDLDSKLAWLRQLLEWQSDMKDSQEFMDSLKIDFFSDDVLVFTPKGTVVDLVKGSTPIDFAFTIHTAIGTNCVGAKVNGRLVPLDYKLETGDIVEIITSKHSAGPSRDWLNIVKTSQAKTKIKHWLKKEFREENIIKGKDMLENAARRQGFSLPQLLKTEWLEPVYKKYTLGSVEDLYAAVGYGGVQTSRVLTRLIEEYRKENKIEIEQARVGPLAARRPKRPIDHGVLVKGEPDIMVRFAKCCTPLPGDDIVGYITRGRGVSVHQRDCVNLRDLEDFENRRVEVTWANENNRAYLAEIQVMAQDRAGLLMEISQLLNNMNLSALSVNARVTKNKTAFINFSVEINDTQMLDKIIKQIRNLPDVTRVFRSHA
jgi:guanosine-3',5'-bis(diphosphate) 3'-pyrophosphohydrolase